MPRPQKYSDELRERAVRLVFESERPIAHVARDLGIHKEALRLWVRQAEADAGTRNDRLTSDERDRLKALEREVRELRRANEIPQGRIGVFREGARRNPAEGARRRPGTRALPPWSSSAARSGCRSRAYYQRRGGERSARDLEDERLLARIGRAARRPTTAPTATAGCGRRWAGPARTSGAIASGA